MTVNFSEVKLLQSNNKAGLNTKKNVWKQERLCKVISRHQQILNVTECVCVCRSDAGL